MFGFKKSSELDRLRAVYADQSDGELLRLHEEREGLTDAAREALAEVMKLRNLEADAADGPATELVAEEQGISIETLALNEVPVYTFSDTYQLRDMLRLLEEANIAFRLEDHSDVRQAGLRSVRQTGVTVMVERSQEKEAKACLRQVLFTSGLDAEEPPALVFTEPSDLVLLLTCDRADALGLVHALAAAGISFYWRDGREDEEVPGEDVVAIEVHTPQRERADKIMQEWMNSGTADDTELTPEA